MKSDWPTNRDVQEMFKSQEERFARITREDFRRHIGRVCRRRIRQTRPREETFTPGNLSVEEAMGFLYILGFSCNAQRRLFRIRWITAKKRIEKGLEIIRSKLPPEALE